MINMPLDQLETLFLRMGENYTVYAPAEHEGVVTFCPWDSHSRDKVCLDQLQTDKSAKEFFFPQSETMYYAKTGDGTIEIVEEEKEDKPEVYFGVRACDCKSFAILDRVFLSEPVDTYYERKRTNGTVITLACNEPERTCFCQTFGIDPAVPGGDIETFVVGENLYWNSLTEKGRKLTELVKDLFTETSEEALQKTKQEIREKVDKLPLKGLCLDAFNGDYMDLFASPEWERLSESCLGCGTCTFVCPTCQCYDIRDYQTKKGVQKFRCWDSCMYSDFTMMAHGNNRTTQMQRFRQRFMHKLVYFPENNDGEYSCVGCGRCLKKCPSSLNIVKVIKALGGNENE